VHAVVKAIIDTVEARYDFFAVQMV